MSRQALLRVAIRATSTSRACPRREAATEPTGKSHALPSISTSRTKEVQKASVEKLLGLIMENLKASFRGSSPAMKRLKRSWRLNKRKRSGKRVPPQASATRRSLRFH